MPTFSYYGQTVTIDTVYSYARVSSLRQTVEEGGEGIPRQLELHDEFAALYGVATDHLGGDQLQFIDSGLSGSKGHHLKDGAGLAAFMKLAATGKLKPNAGLTVESFSRLGRMPIDLFNKLFWSIIEAGVTLITLKDHRAYSRESVRNDKGQVYQIQAAMQAAGSYAEDLSYFVAKSWKVRRGTATTVAPSWLSKWAKMPNQSDFVEVTHFKGMPKGTLKELRLDKAKTEIVRYLCCDLMLRMGYHSAAQLLNARGIPTLTGRKRHRSEAVWDGSLITTIVRSRSLLGEQKIGKYVDGKHVDTGELCVDAWPAAITESEWYTMQQAINARQKGTGAMDGRKTGRMTNIFGELARCSVCGNRMAVMSRGKATHLYLACSMGRMRRCSASKYHRLDMIEQAILGLFAEAALINVQKTPDDPAQALQTERDNLIAETAQLEAAYEKLFDEYGLEPAGSPPRKALDKRAEQIRLNGERIKKLESEIAALRIAKPVAEQYAAIQALVEGLDGLPDDERIAVRARIATALPSVVGRLVFSPHGRVSIEMAKGYSLKSQMASLVGQPIFFGDFTGVASING